jgi:hypothetical protein
MLIIKEQGMMKYHMATKQNGTSNSCHLFSIFLIKSSNLMPGFVKLKLSEHLAGFNKLLSFARTGYLYALKI